MNINIKREKHSTHKNNTPEKTNQKTHTHNKWENAETYNKTKQRNTQTTKTTHT